MHSWVLAKDLRSLISLRPCDSFQQTSTETVSTNASGWFDRTTSYLAQSAVFCAFVQANLTSGEKLTVTGNLQDATSSTGAGVADFGTTANQTADVGSTSSTAAQSDIFGGLFYGIDMTEANQFIRTQVSIDFSTSSSVQDCDVFVALAEAGFEKLPTT